MKDPRAFPCMDDDPRNNGYGTSRPNPYDNYIDERDEQPEEETELDNEIENDEIPDSL